MSVYEGVDPFSNNVPGRVDPSSSTVRKRLGPLFVHDLGQETGFGLVSEQFGKDSDSL